MVSIAALAARLARSDEGRAAEKFLTVAIGSDAVPSMAARTRWCAERNASKSAGAGTVAKTKRSIAERNSSSSGSSQRTESTKLPLMSVRSFASAGVTWLMYRPGLGVLPFEAVIRCAATTASAAENNCSEIRLGVMVRQGK